MTGYAGIDLNLPDGGTVTIQELWADPDIVLQHEEIERLFRHQCVRCGILTRVVHELVPRSIAGKKWYYWSNRVVLCPKCHRWAHDVGTNNSRPILTRLRDQRLEALYGPRTETPIIDP